jgi:hypothetical protein
MPTDPDVPLNSRGTPRQRFDPLRDAPRADSAENPDFEQIPEFSGSPDDLISAVRRQIAALGLSESVEGQAAICAAEGAMESTGAARAACLHQLLKAMDVIKAAKPSQGALDPTEDVLSRRRDRKAGA